jgi:hypothetical protein
VLAGGQGHRHCNDPPYLVQDLEVDPRQAAELVAGGLGPGAAISLGDNPSSSAGHRCFQAAVAGTRSGTGAKVTVAWIPDLNGPLHGLYMQASR